MKRTTITRALLVAGLVGFGVLVACSRTPAPGAAAKANALPWGHDLTTALATAESQNKVVMVDLYADWCVWCHRLDETTYADTDVQSALKSVVLVKLNADQGAGRALFSKYRIDGLPTVMFFNGRGKEVGRITGYLPPGPFLAELRHILQRA